MGTNYYLHITKGWFHKTTTIYHIGLSSAGWRFNFQFFDNLAESVEAWKAFTKTGKIKDEYGRTVQYDNFWDIVASKQYGQRFLDIASLSDLFKPDRTKNIQVGEYDFTKGQFC